MAFAADAKRPKMILLETMYMSKFNLQYLGLGIRVRVANSGIRLQFLLYISIMSQLEDRILSGLNI